jgi:E3 ubiquitin-protein ligase FANCL
MDEIDKVLWVIDPTKPTYAMSHRRIALGNFLILPELVVEYLLSFILTQISMCCLISPGDDCYILLNVDARKPSSLPE